MTSPYSKPMWQRVADAVGNIRRMLVVPCGPEVSVWVELGIEAALVAMWTIEEPDEKEAYHKILGKSLVCSLKTEIRDAHKMSGGEEGPALRFLFRTAELVDKAVWKLFLAAVAADALILWSNMLNKQSGCKTPGNPNYGSGTGYTGALAFGGPWQSMDYFFTAPSRFAPVSPASVVVRPGKNWICADSCGFHDAFNLQVATKARVINETSGDILDQDEQGGFLAESTYRPHVFQKGVNSTGAVQIISAQHIYTGPDVPFHEVFPDQLQMFCNIFTPE